MGNRLFYILLVIVVAAVLGYVCGVLVAGVMNDHRTERLLQRRSVLTASVLSEIGNLSEGDTLLNFPFETLEFESVMLKELVERPSIITIMNPSCESCIGEIAAVADLRADSSGWGFIVISKDNPRYLIDMKNEYGLHHPVLYDYEGAFIHAMNIQVYPFHIFVDKNLVVLRLIAGPLTAEELRAFLTPDSVVGAAHANN